MKNLFKLFIVIVALFITACTQIFENINNIDQIKPQGQLVMKVVNESRTIIPTIKESDIKSAVLTANDSELKNWSGDNIISQIQRTDDILLDVGTYVFTMTFYYAEKEAILTATTSKDIVAGNNSLNFDMKPVESGAGDILITLNWDNPSEINKITAGLYDIANNTPVEGFEDSALEITYTEEQTPIATYSKNGVPVGQYIIKFKSYKDDILLNTSTDVIKVVAGITTSTQITLSKINRQYTISYNLNEGKWVNGFIPTESRNGNKKIVLPNAENIEKDGYEFAGWYDDNNNRITEIPSDTMENIYVTAKWLQLYTITYNLNGGENNTNNPTSYTVETETITLGIPTKNSSTFLGWYNESGDKITEIKPSETAANITVTASWRTTCTQSDVCEVIASLSGPHDILVTGSMHSNFIADYIKTALNGNQNIKVNLDLSQTTGMNEITTWAFESMSGLSSVILPDTVTSIGTFAFQGCSNLKSINIPNGVEIIGEYTFNGCSSLTEIDIPDSVTTIDSSAFSGCNAVKTLVTGNGLTSLDYLPITSALESITIGDSITEIGDNKFYEFTNLKSVTFADNSQLTKIGENAFCGCSQLTEITIPDGVTTISSSAFNGCSNLASVEIPDTVTTIGSYVFYGCGLTSVTIPDTVTTIGSSAFGFCGSLTSVEIPDGVSTIGSYAFRNCSNLASVTIGKNVTSIGSYAFWCCEKLTSVTIPVSVISIDNNAFKDCSSLTTVNYKGTQEQWSQISIGGNGNDALTNVNYNYTE